MWYSCGIKTKYKPLHALFELLSSTITSYSWGLDAWMNENSITNHKSSTIGEKTENPTSPAASIQATSDKFVV